ncbi:Uma2 family endonuclease [Stieleria sp. ICT_E10.1]|uniref:Uma2 family endonuclease n=1 Tax=Stieleria sedimenti TaxID=2976331 RepID=UPI0021800669|nr:Uma2 family endonuclease [Stieleria sedimenti]MCS7469688.1 Uma2 family endonuclease [Stieleria sedimenti]
MSKPTVRETSAEYSSPVPILNSGDVLDSDEFFRRYAASPGSVFAERINGRVYLTSPLHAASHGDPHALFATWLGTYAAQQEALTLSDNPTVRLDANNDPQPDLCMRRENGNTRLVNGYIHGPPELIVEIASSSASYDLGEKKLVYQRAGVLEYLVYETEKQNVVWWRLEDGAYVELPAVEGASKSCEFRGLWLDESAMRAGDGKALLATLAEGMRSIS